MSEQYENLAYRWFEEVWNKKREEVIEELFLSYGHGFGLMGAEKLNEDTDNYGSMRGPEEFRPFYKVFCSAFPDINIEVVDTISEGDKIAARCFVTGTHTGIGLEIPPTGKKVEFTGMCIIRVLDGKILEAWNNFDFITMYQQLGALKPNPR